MQLERIKALRAVERTTKHGFYSVLQRSVGEIVISLLVKHETFSNFFSPVPLELPRWKNFMVWRFYLEQPSCLPDFP